GQYAKPRSTLTEIINGETMPAYRGDCVNGFEATPESRKPDPLRLGKSYFYSAATLNFIRAMIDSGFADLHHPYSWNLHAIEKSERWDEYSEIVEHILDAIHFMESFGGIDPDELGRIDFYTSHEGLLLPFEQAMTRKSPDSGKYYNTGAHMLWIGDRTRGIDSGHVEYFRGISNPVGVKLGPECNPKELAELVKLLNPENEAGKIILITRLGDENVGKKLPLLIHAVLTQKLSVTWSCDPMHGNTTVTSDGYKTRDFARILSELEETFHVHRTCESRLAGVHFELTGDDVTECTGGAQDIRDSNLSSNYRSYCDPRLNDAQSLEMAFLIAQLIKENNT
ncbi:MAG: 3-deoxy-7-phosphoheptulonate synthase, partial [Spirochaetaceae bacterium]